MKHLEGYPPGIRFLFVLGLVTILCAACCQTGAFEDNFGRFYSLVTIPTDDFLQPFNTSGTVDTLDMGCGVWNIRPPLDGEPPIEPGEPVDTTFVAVNPNPNPADQCCFAFRFDGEAVVCTNDYKLVLGEYLNVGGKCKPILDDDGEPIPVPMFLQTPQ